MAADISVGIGVLGETEFKKALTACQNTLKQLDSGLKANAAEFEANADAMGNNAERAQLLKRTLEEQRKLERALGEAVEYAAGEYGEASTQTTKYVVAQNRAREAIAKVEKELKDADREMEELGRDSLKVARQIDSGITEAAQDAERSLDSMIETIKTDLGSIRSNTTISAIADIGEAISGTFTAANDFAESTRDRRRELAMLETNALLAGQDYQAVYDVAMGIAALTGDMNASIEATSALLQTGFDTEEMRLALETLGGAVIAFPETMKIENLAESLQESIAAGEATGAFAELMERAGMKTEDFKNAMAAAKDEEEKQQVALSYLNAMGLRPTYETYMGMNGELVEAQAATDKLSDAIARLGGTVDTWLTPIKTTAAEALTGLLDLWEGYDTVFGMAREKFLEEARKKTGGVFAEDNAPMIRTDFSEAMSNIVSGFNLDNLFGEENVDKAKEWAREKLSSISSALQGSEKETGEVENGMSKVFSDALEAAVKTPPTIDQMPEGGGWGEGVDALWEIISGKSKEGGKKAGEDGMNEVGNSLKGGGILIQEEALISGTNIGSALASGLSAGCAEAESIVASTVSAINALWAKLQTPVIPSFGGSYYADAGIGGMGSGLGSYTVNMSIDGKTFGRATAGYTSLAQAATVNRLARLNA